MLSQLFLLRLPVLSKTMRVGDYNRRRRSKSLTGQTTLNRNDDSTIERSIIRTDLGGDSFELRSQTPPCITKITMFRVFPSLGCVTLAMAFVTPPAPSRRPTRDYLSYYISVRSVYYLAWVSHAEYWDILDSNFISSLWTVNRVRKPMERMWMRGQRLKSPVQIGASD